MNNSHVDVLIVGAGLSGIGAACHLRRKCPDRSYAILEARGASGGTWDLFRYPGIRSDSDMYTLGYAFKPWLEAKAIADGPSILKYIRETATEYKVDEHIHYHRKVTAAVWDSTCSNWTVTVSCSDTDSSEQYTCNFLLMCSGYYNYEHGHVPEFEGSADFSGQVVHAQQWTEDINYAGKNVVVIGSGATAVTLVPELAKQTASTTMLQRSPTYVVSVPETDKLAHAMRRYLPESWAYFLTRWKKVLLNLYFFKLARRKPKQVKHYLLKLLRDELGPDYDIQTHFTPSYKPWDERICAVPDGDLFKALKSGDAEVVTDHVARFTEGGIALKSGRELKANLIVLATGLELKFMGGIEVTVDGKSIKPNELFAYRGTMFSNVPNLALSFGYTNSSWTLKCDLTCEYMCRILNHMKKTGTRVCIPVMEEGSLTAAPFLDFTSGYVQRAIDTLPQQGADTPWRLHQNYALDIFNLRYSSLNDKVLEFS